MTERNPYHKPAGSSEGGQFTTGQLGALEDAVNRGAGLQIRFWAGFPLRSDIGESPNIKDVPPERDEQGDFILYHGTSGESAGKIIESKTIKTDDMGTVGVTTVPEMASVYASYKKDATILKVVIKQEWLSKQHITHEIGGHGFNEFLIRVKGGVPLSAIKHIQVFHWK